MRPYDELRRFMSVNLGVNLASSSASNSGQFVQQLPAIQQIFTHNATVKPNDTPHNVIQQTILPVSGQACSQSVLAGNQPMLAGNQSLIAGNQQILTQTGLQFLSHSPQSGLFGAQQTLLSDQQHAGQINMGGRGLVGSSFQLVPRNYSVVNQSVQGTNVALHLSPQQLGTGLAPNLSPIEQQQLLQPQTFDPGLAALHGQQQQQSPPQQQLMLSSPGQQFTIQSPGQHFNLGSQAQFPTPGPAMAQFTPQGQLLTQTQGGNLLLQAQNGSMIVQGENFIPGAINQGVFIQNPVIHNANQQLYASAQNVLSNNQIQGVFSQSPMLTNQNVGLISINQAQQGKCFGNQMDKVEAMNPGVNILNQQMQLLAQIAQHSSPDSQQQHHVLSNQVKPGQQTINLVNQSPTMSNNINQNQSLPSFGHFLLHHHMQSLPHPFLQNLSITTSSAINPVGGKPENQIEPIQGVTVSPVDVSSLNAQFNSWNKGQVQGRVRKRSGSVQSSTVSTHLPSAAPSAVAKAAVQTASSTSTVVHKSCKPVSVTKTTCSVACRTNVAVDSECLPPALLKTLPVLPETKTLPRECGTSAEPKPVTVPHGWLRTVENNTVVYYSPTSERLMCKDSVRQYLLSDGTCKCGLQCPLHMDAVFNFRADVGTALPTTLEDHLPGTHLCKYRAQKSVTLQLALTVGVSSQLSLATKSDVSMVTSSGMMSPRVSSTVQETHLDNSSSKIPQGSEVRDDIGVPISSEHVGDTNSVNQPLVSDAVSSMSHHTESHGHSDSGDKLPMESDIHTQTGCDEPVSVTIQLLQSGDNRTLNVNSVDLPSSTKEGNTHSINIAGNDVCVSNSNRCEQNVSEVDTISKTHSAIAACLSAPSNLDLRPPHMSRTLDFRKPLKPSEDGSNKVRNTTVGLTREGTKSVSKPVLNKTLSPKVRETLSNSGLANSVTIFQGDAGPVPDFSHISLPGAVNRILDKDSDSELSIQTIHPGIGAVPCPSLKSPVVSPNVFNSFQANLLANLHKLTSPPNQQVFPPEIPASSIPLAYTHSAISSKKVSLPCASPELSVQPIVSQFVSQHSNGTGQIMDLALLREKLKEYRSASKSGEAVKLESVYDSDGPPPNVDVSVLKDKGHGPIPKELIMMATSKSSLASNTSDVFNGTISSTSSSPRPDDSKQIEVETDSQANVIRSDSACSDRLPVASPITTENNSNAQEDGSKICATNPQISNNITTATSEQSRQSNKALVEASVKSNMLVDVNQCAPTASSPPTPSTVVHHTPTPITSLAPTPLTCHQLSLNKARQQTKAQKIQTPTMYDLLNDASILSPLAAILSNPTICNAFRHMFPEVMQEAVLKSMGALDSSPVSSELPVGAATDMLLKASGNFVQRLPGSLHFNADKQITTSVPTDANLSQKKSFSAQDSMNSATGEFPASSLLSAAAKAQFFQQQNYLKMLINQQVQIQPDLVTGQTVLPQSTMSVNPVSTVQPSASVAQTSPDLTLSTNTESLKSVKGPSKISELLNRAGPIQQSQSSGITLAPALVQQIQHKPRPPQQLLQPQTSASNAHIQSQNPVSAGVHLPNPLPGSLVISPSMPSSMAGNLLIRPQGPENQPALAPNVLQMFASVGLPFQAFNVQGPQGGKPVVSTSDLLQLQNLLQNSNKLHPDVPLLLQSQQQQMQHPMNIQNVQNMLPNMGDHGVNPAMLNLASLQPTSIGLQLQNQLHSTNVQRVSIPQLVLGSPPIEMPSRQNQAQVLGTGQINHPGNGMPVNLINIHQNLGNGTNLQGMPSQTGNQTGGMAQMQMNNTNNVAIQQIHQPNSSQPSGPVHANSGLAFLQQLQHNLNSIPVQVSSGNNLTAMHIQALQLQQQLLQQLQQVQGMQTLINQFNIQGLQPGKSVSTSKSQLTPTTAVAVSQSFATSTCVPVASLNTVSTSQALAGKTVAPTSVFNSCPVTDAALLVPSANATREPTRVIAAADTTEECSSSAKTCDIGTETDAVDDEDVKDENDDEEEPEDEEDSDQDINEKEDFSTEEDNDKVCDDNEKDDVEQYDTASGDTDESAERLDSTNPLLAHLSNADSRTIVSEGFTDVKELYKASVSSKVDETSGQTTTVEQPVKPITTCLAIATEKGNRSRKQKSSLAKSQNLSAELSIPSEGELKLKIRKRHLTLSNNIKGPFRNRKRNRKKQVPHQYFERKELRSSTQAATKASSMLAASTLTELKSKGENEEPQNEANSDHVKEVALQSNQGNVNHEEYICKKSWEVDIECDSSSNHVDELTDNIDTENSEQNELKSKIAAALSSQKGCWLLSSPKKKQEEQNKSTSLGSVEVKLGLKGLKRSRQNFEQNTAGTDDNTVTQVEPEKLKTLSQGLEAHHRARKKHRRGRKMNSHLEQAIQQAMIELDRQTNSGEADGQTNTTGMEGNTSKA
ncbi:MBD5-like protein [Mya arenaria]|uniref:MBD5-like protein n=1 Tax=Mya arenaria TaxID=6604 RepID=A0ABY7E3S5_MYAAR|nr:MBD5-like protein [Mya arenaria]